MSFARPGRVALLLTLLVGAGVPCTTTPAPAEPASARPSTRTRALLAWRPRAWVPPVSSEREAEGLRIAIDPVDGAFGMPEPEALAPGSRIADDAPVRMTWRPNGSGRAQLDERFADFAVASVGASGAPRWTCVHGRRHAAGFVARAQTSCPEPSPAAPWAEK